MTLGVPDLVAGSLGASKNTVMVETLKTNTVFWNSPFPFYILGNFEMDTVVLGKVLLAMGKDLGARRAKWPSPKWGGTR